MRARSNATVTIYATEGRCVEYSCVHWLTAHMPHCSYCTGLDWHSVIHTKFFYCLLIWAPGLFISKLHIWIWWQQLEQWLSHSHLQSFATPPPRVASRRREVIRHADGRGWEKMENVEFRNFPSMTSRKSYCIWKIIIFETVSRWLTCDYITPPEITQCHIYYLPWFGDRPPAAFAAVCWLAENQIQLNSYGVTWSHE